MKAWLSLVLMATMAGAAWGEGLTRVDDDHITQVEINGKTYSNINRVYIAGDKVIINFTGGGTSAALDKVPTDFLESWGIGESKLGEAKAAVAEQGEKKTTRAIQAGCFREVNGIVYDTRNAKSGWLTFKNMKVIQIVGDSLLVDPSPNDYLSSAVILLRNAHSTLGDNDYISFTALPDGTFSYINKLGTERTVRAFTLGRVCGREEIPVAVLNGTAVYAALESGTTPKKDVVATLPDSENVNASGTGFFISKDGYLITNDHVVKNARRVKIKIGDEVYPAKIVREDAEHDLALLKAEGQFKALAISPEDAELGQSVFTIGFPDIKLQGTEPKYTDGKISSVAGLQDDPDQFQISVPVQPGNSGGPLADNAGNVLGVIVARLDDLAGLRSTGSLPQNVNYAIKGKVLRDFLRESTDIKYVAASSTKESGIKVVRQAVALLLTY